MTDEEATKEIREWIEADGAGEISIISLSLALSALRERIEQKNGGWISVKDRLPLPEPPERERSNPGNTSANPYWQRVCAIADKQRAKGITEYGQGLEDNPAGIVQRITYLEEELVDGLMYCEWIKDRLKGERIHE